MAHLSQPGKNSGDSAKPFGVTNLTCEISEKASPEKD